MKRMVLFTMMLLAAGLAASAIAGGPRENSRSVYRMILSQADTNKDGKLSVAECMAIYKDKNRARKNCTYWDADGNGIITEDEYNRQALKTGIKKF